MALVCCWGRELATSICTGGVWCAQNWECARMWSSVAARLRHFCGARHRAASVNPLHADASLSNRRQGNQLAPGSAAAAADWSAHVTCLRVQDHHRREDGTVRKTVRTLQL